MDASRRHEDFTTHNTVIEYQHFLEPFASVPIPIGSFEKSGDTWTDSGKTQLKEPSFGGGLALWSN